MQKKKGCKGCKDAVWRFDGLIFIDFPRELISGSLLSGQVAATIEASSSEAAVHWSEFITQFFGFSLFCRGLNFNKTPKVSGSIWTPKATCRLEWIWKIWKVDFWETKLIWLCQGPFSSQQMALWYCPQRDPWEQALKFSFKKRIVVPRRRCYSMCGRL